MRVAADDFRIAIGGETISLRPTLRAAMRLERRYFGFVNLAGKVQDGNVTVIADILSEGADLSSSATLALMPSHRLGLAVAAITGDLLAFIVALTGLDESDLESAKAKEPTPAPAPKFTFADHFQSLFGIATGWLGWTPEQAWNATPAEIMAAHRGRMDMLAAIFGKADSDKPAEGPIEHSAADIARGNAVLRTMTKKAR